MSTGRIFFPTLITALFLSASCKDHEKLSQSVTVSHGAVNGAIINRNGKNLAVYGDPLREGLKAEILLLTHSRRDVIWAGRDMAENGIPAIAPSYESEFFGSSDSCWRSSGLNRFHDYYCQSSRIGYEPFKVSRYVKDGDLLQWQDIDFKVVSTPGYTRGSVSFIATIDQKRYAFTGDLIYGDGKIPDLYSFQDSVGGIGGYHGYAARLAALMSSLSRIMESEPDIIVPVRGPVIRDPAAAIENLMKNVKELYTNYLTASAYRWYYPERLDKLSKTIPGPEVAIDCMPYGSLAGNDTPDWYVHISNSNLVIADDSTAFLIDCGIDDALQEVISMRNSGRIKKIDGIFITHYHDDHTDLINEAVKEFGCPVYATGELKDILENPSHYDLPCLTSKPIKNITVMNNGQEIQWKDFKVKFYYFPGQTIYHDAVMFSKEGERPVFFTGDSFTPSGIDDYCLLNRNIIREGQGYLYCLDLLKGLPANVLFSNQHVDPLFDFSEEQFDIMRDILLKRIVILRRLLPFDDVNYGIDEQWAWTYPYSQQSATGEEKEVAVRVINYSAESREFELTPSQITGYKFLPVKATVVVEPGCEARQIFRFKVMDNAVPGVQLLTFNVKSGDLDLREWCEALVEVAPL